LLPVEERPDRRSFLADLLNWHPARIRKRKNNSKDFFIFVVIDELILEL
jgi:hypothetical protein